MTKEKPIVLVDTGKRIKHKIGNEVYYRYVTSTENLVTCPRENSPDPKHRLDILGIVGKELNSDYVDGGYK